ncbi:hypothetical protein VP1G_10889 [Cytospora mali]|uniref:Uncharacterized protein n=1 Tax=Cytospora mali TaxID=578113 RepID=A0A194V0N4_CYTMA|nr:hypothetical protein VP1G_10889 [Valsa mali var. pyri (nom. inval.)]
MGETPRPCVYLYDGPENLLAWANLKGPFLLIGEDLLTPLAASHTLLLLLTGLAVACLDLLLGRHNLVAHGIELLLLVIVLLVESRTTALTLDPVVSGRRHLTVKDGPDLLSEILGELGVVSDDDDTTLELLDGLGQGTEGVTIQVVGGLVKDDQVRSLPRASSQDNLDTLTTRQTLHARVGNQLIVKTEVAAVSLNLLTDQRTELTRGEGLLHVNVSNQLLVRSQQLGTGQPLVVGRHHGHLTLVLLASVLDKSERALVLVRVLELSTGVNADDATLRTADPEDLLGSKLIILSDDLVGTVHSLTVLTGLETPLDVLGWGLVQVVIDVGESVLLDVGDTDVLVGPNLTLGGDELTGQDVDQGGLSSTVGANDGNTRAQRALEGDVGDLRLGGTRVLEGHPVGTQDGLGLGLNTLKETRLREGELDLGSTKLEVSLGLGVFLDELGQVTLVGLELEVTLVVDDVLANAVEETRVVRHDDRGAVRVLKVVLEPLNVLHVQVVRGLVKQQDIGVLEDGTAQGKLHLPTTGERGNLAVDHGVGETELVETASDLSLGDNNLSLLQLLHGPLNSRHLGIGSVQVVLDEHGLDLVLLGETLDLLVVDGTHEGGLSGTVGAAETIASATLKAETGAVEKNLGTVGERELTLAEVLVLVILIFLSSLGLSDTGRSLLAQGLDNSLSVLVADKDTDVGLELVSPRPGVGLLLVDQLTSNGGDVLEERSKLVLGGSLVLGRQDLLEVGQDNSDLAVVGRLRNLAVLDVTNTLEGLEGLLGLSTSLGVSQVLVVLLQTWQHLGQERSDHVGVVDKLAHVVNNDSRLSLDGSLAFSQTTVKKRDHEGQSRLLDLGDESGGTEQVDGLGDILRLGDTLDQLRNEPLNILVGDKCAKLLHSLVRTLLDLLLCVPHGLGNDGEQVDDTEGGLNRAGLDELVEDVEDEHLLLPLLGISERLVEGTDNVLDGIGVDGLSDGQTSAESGGLDRGDLVTSSGQDGGQKDDEERLDVGGNLGVTGNGLDGTQGLLADGGILLVGELLLQRLDGPARFTC